MEILKYESCFNNEFRNHYKTKVSVRSYIISKHLSEITRQNIRFFYRLNRTLMQSTSFSLILDDNLLPDNVSKGCLFWKHCLNSNLLIEAFL